MLKKYLKQYKLLLLISFILVVLQVFSFLYQPEIISNVVSELNKADINQTRVDNLGIEIIIVGIIGLVAGVLNTFVAAKISQGVGADIRRDGFKNIQTLSFADIEKFSTSNLVVRLTNDVTQVQTVLMLGIQMLLRIPFLFFGAFILAVIALPSLWWTIVLYVIVIVIIVMLMGRATGPKFGQIQRDVDSVNTIIKENLDGVRVVKSFGTEEKEKHRYEEKVNSLTKNYIQTGMIFSITVPSFMFTANIITAFAIYYVAGPAIDNPALIGDVVSFMSYIFQLMIAIVMGGFLMMTITRAVVSTKRINEVLEAKPSFTYGNDELNTFEKMEFKDVSFAYDQDGEDVLKNISFTVNKGEKIGVVGSTGSGKTTLVQLIPRLYDVSSGEILINGKNLNTYSKKSVNNKISIVLQKAQLFSGKIKDVIYQGKNNADEKDIELAAQRAQAYEFIQKKEGKFEGEVLQKGANFSGGQKQRLSIARGFVKNPEILILDDSTSALDARSENLVKEAIDNELNDVTTIIVAQKISSVVNTDKIIVLDEGKVDAIGTHKELIEKSAVYREIYETQKGKGEK